MRFLHPASQGSRALLARASVLTTAALLLGAMLTPASASVSTVKMYADGVYSTGSSSTPLTSMSAGQSVDATFFITNEATTQTLGSADITPPFFLSSGTVLSGPLTLHDPSASGATASLDSAGIHLRDLNLAPGATVTVDFTIQATCSASGTDSWSTLVKQSNNFNGPPGNNFTVDGADPSLTITGASCHLAFRTQPANALVNTDITTQAFDPTGPPIQVEAYSGDPANTSTWVPISGVSVSIAYLNADVTGAPTVLTSGLTGSDGTVSFSNLQIGTSADYWLQASATNFPSVRSDSSQAAGGDQSFAITDTYESCAPGTSCPTQVTYSNTIATVSSTGGSTGGYVAAGITGNYAGSCDGYQAYSGAIVTAIVTTGTQSFVTLELEKALSGKTGVSSFEVCFESDASFTGLYGTVPAYTFGLLADCTNPNTYDNAPCVVSRTRSTVSKSNVLITVALPLSGDPKLFS